MWIKRTCGTHLFAADTFFHGFSNDLSRWSRNTDFKSFQVLYFNSLQLCCVLVLLYLPFPSNEVMEMLRCWEKCSSLPLDLLAIITCIFVSFSVISVDLAVFSKIL